MDEDYYELTSELDVREVLRYLNYLGIQNISGEVLKYFITDLKKLIRYDLQQKYKKQEEHKQSGPERLHSASTFCSRIRSKTQSNEKVFCSRECNRLREPLKLRNIHSAPVLGQKRVIEQEEPMKRSCSCQQVEKRLDTGSRVTRPSTSGLSNNIIKVPIPPAKKKSDPVSLYHYYTSLWAKYKPNVPGENDWAGLRWHVRQKMAGLPKAQTENKIPRLQLRVKNNAKDKK